MPVSEGVAGNSDAVLTIDELADAAGVPVRTIRYYIAESLLPGPGARGKAAVYTQEHLLRLRLIRVLVEQRVPLAEIRERVSGLSNEDIRSLLSQETQLQSTLSRIAEAPSPKAYIGALLERARSHRSSVAPSPSSSLAPPAAYSPAPRLRSAAPVRPAPPSAALEAAGSQPRDSLTWRREELAPGIELHVRSDVERAQPDLVRRLLSLATNLVATALPGRGRPRT